MFGIEKDLKYYEGHVGLVEMSEDIPIGVCFVEVNEYNVSNTSIKYGFRQHHGGLNKVILVMFLTGLYTFSSRTIEKTFRP